MTTFVALGYRDFRILWAGLVVSSLGLQMQALGLGWLMVEIAVRDGTPERAPLNIGLLGLARAVPGVALSLVSGVLADHVERRRLMLVAYASAGTSATLLAMLTISSRITVPAAMVLVAVGTAALAVDSTTRIATVARIVPARALMSAQGLSSFSIQVSGVAGPLLGGVLIGSLGTGGLMALHAATYPALVLGVLLLGPLRPLAAMTGGRVLGSVAEGLRHVAGDPVLRSAVALSVTISVFAVPYVALLPAVAHEHLGAGAVELSWLLAAIAAGSLPGAFLTASLGAVRSRGVILAGASLAVGLSIALLALQPSLTGALLAAPLTGFSMTVFVGTAISVLIGQCPEAMRGRIFSVHVTCVAGLGPLGTMLLGSLGTVIGVNLAVALGGVAAAAITGSLLLGGRSLRELRTSPS